MKRKSWVTSLMSVVLISMFVTACGGNTTSNTASSAAPAVDKSTTTPAAGKKSSLTVGMVTDIGGVNDNSFNQSAWEGLKSFESQTGGKVDYLQSQGDADYVTNLNQFVKNKRSLIWGIGFMMGDAMKQVADANKDSKFAIIDAVVDAPNVESVTFKENEGSYLVGVVAGLMTKTNKIGFVGGAEIPVIKRFELGFVAGVKAVNPNAKVVINYTGAFNAPDQGKAAAATIYNDGADIIFHAAGSTGDGVFNEAIERKKKNKDIWVIGVDKDQSATFGNDVTLTSMMKRVNEAVIRVSTDLDKNDFKGGKVQDLGLAENAVGLPEKNPNIPADILKKVHEYEVKIVNKEITVPTAK
ncbi:BMP family ABC transporter substrate-binding protein [Paenibacillus alba]|uniref:BMP family lipoprotein n=1 Tax=Paenibacillus alba TaxID=1197127 RepID=UPI0015670290|nr:BMP family ABC transporter substrate-binding protein [Paenibacillus alba]NQX69033.1 BMP family ABC transporter substrate-binding protein [Paenibacillus alba]